ncbi:aldo/keto reductase [Halapricum hydrolyticum]|uniref:Aldo/keto reductase n=1 Tax=Halapricum hydrolyticum TaxID=2979991 RepID=A0AAE3LJB2_9EURY|nr:aldo/keto reductase [Halapricum hydrolyticum]MCU4717963.1 aldo/keto reductase [Halapricum hydrolyticum]MCU4727128.1 aldo/keto reductase [Halapricum hydrolyticum]
MEYVRLGETGLEVSPIALGTWRFGMEHEETGIVETGREEAHELLDAYAEMGGNFVDTANGYGGGDSERWIGEWLDDQDREDYVIASKCYWSDVSRFQENLSAKNVRAEVEGSLEKLDTGYLDILYLHRFDDETPIEKTLRTVDDLISEGKVHHVGLSTADAWKLTKGLWKADVNNYEAFTVTQPQYSAVYRDPVAEYLDVCEDQNLAVCPYSPLHGGFLTGKYERVGDGEIEAPDGSRGDIDEHFEDWYLKEDAWDVLEEIRAVAEETGASPAQISLAWLLHHEALTIVPIIGARTPEQLEENLGAVDVELTDAQFERIDAAMD